MQKLFAFWKYDIYPYVLGAYVIAFHDDGSVEVDGYQGMRFLPIKILPYVAGEKLWTHLKELQTQHNAALKEFNKTWVLKARTLADFIE